MNLFVPGRICLFGEHSDWAGGYRRVNATIEKGYTLISGTEQGIYAHVEPHPDALVLTATTHEGERLGPREISMDPAALIKEAQRGEFWSYVAGVAYYVSVHFCVNGLVIDNYKTDLPIKKGLSSSAAICVLAARAFNQLYDLQLTTRGEMELAYQGEIITPSRCGRMDQGCAFGNQGVLMTFDGDHLETEGIKPGRDLYFVLVDLQAEKDTMEILARLNRCYPMAIDEVERGVQDLLGPINRRIVHQATAALKSGQAERIGQLMREAQDNFDRFATPACPRELTAPVLHRVLNYGPIQSHIWGGKGVGSQGDGTAQFIARSKADQLAMVDIIERELGMPCLTLTLKGDSEAQATPVQVSPAEAKSDLPRKETVRKAVIPAAGLGTRLFPATKVGKKEFFPIVDHDSIAKPAILVIAEEAWHAGIEEIIIIVQPQDLNTFHALFKGEVPAKVNDKFSHRLREYAKGIQELGQHVSFVLQPTQEGFGHAVFRTREAVGDEPFLLMLGDHLYRAGGGQSCARQMIKAYEQHKTGVLGLRRTPEDEISSYGTATGNWIEKNRLLTLTELAEKPSVDYARDHLRVPGLPDDVYLTLFGLYVIKPQVFDYLAQQIAAGQRERQEFQLTTALEQLRTDDGFLGIIVDGRAYDIGLPEAYAETIHLFREQT